MKYIFTALMALMITSTAHADNVKWFVSTQVEKSVGTSSPFDGRTYDKKIKPYGDDKTVINPHIKDWFVNIKLTDEGGNTTGFQQMYSHSIVRFTDANGQTYNITFKRVPVTDAN